MKTISDNFPKKNAIQNYWSSNFFLKQDGDAFEIHVIYREVQEIEQTELFKYSHFIDINEN